MENVSCLNQKKKYPLEIDVYPYLYDHHLEGKAILPAVEALIILAKTVKLNFPEYDITCLNNAQFPRFLSIPKGQEKIPAFVSIEITSHGFIIASLMSAIKSKVGISRTVEHARVEFKSALGDKISAHPFRTIEKLEGRCINIPAVSIYRELVPFGVAYQNITGDLSLSRDGALAYISGGNSDADDSIIGSPFPLDAAMHAACVWAQRYTAVVPFPIGFKERIIYQMTKKGQTFIGRILPVKYDEQPFIFDIWIFNNMGKVCEIVRGLQMRDVSQGRMKPPSWIKET
jgi:Polyketide synthase dehydratase